MFEAARIKLTAMYLVIIMMVSLSFSIVIYRGATWEFQRRLNIIENRFNTNTPQGWKVKQPVHNYFLDDYYQAQKGIFLILLYTNGVIFVFSAVAGYFLAGKTLNPIENIMNDQKRFIADASHELKTPLTAMQTSIEVALRNKKINLKSAKETLLESLDDVEKLKSLTNSLLILTRYQQNGKNLKMQSVNLKKLINDAVIQFSKIAKRKRIQLKTNLSAVKIKAEKDSIEKLITILLDNAIKFSKEKSDVKISLSKTKKYAVIKVFDKGVGIKKKDIKKIFDRFYRADLSRSSVNSDGFGLGLSIAKKIVKIHKGTIRVKSDEENGTIFTVRLPKA